jgi:hypothetical protein
MPSVEKIVTLRGCKVTAIPRSINLLFSPCGSKCHGAYLTRGTCET